MGLTEALEKLLIWEEGFSAIIKLVHYTQL